MAEITIKLSEEHARAIIAYVCAALDDKEIWLDAGHAEDQAAEEADLKVAQEALETFATQVELA